jgi:hypothetical protein
MRSISILLFAAVCLSCGGYAVAENPYNFRESETYRKLSKGDQEKLDQVHRDFMMLWGAVDQYTDHHEGKLPETLDQLTPYYLSELPTDPFATSETAKNGPKYYTKSKDGWGYRYRKGSPGNRAWIFSSVGLPDFPYLAERSNYGLYMCKGMWISGTNPMGTISKEPKEYEATKTPQFVKPSPMNSESYNRTRVQSSGASGITATPPSLELLPADARELIAQHNNDKNQIQQETRQKIRKLQLPLIAALKKMQDRYMSETSLDEAVAVRDFILLLQISYFRPLPGPESVYHLQQYVGSSFYFLIKGDDSGSIWGTDVYTSESQLAAAAVHAGLLKPGQTDVVKVTILPQQSSYRGSMRNGITSKASGSFPTSYKMEAVSDNDKYMEKEEKQAGWAAMPGRRIGIEYPQFSPDRPLPNPDAPLPASLLAGLPGEARKLVDAVETESESVRKDANKLISVLQKNLAKALKVVQDRYTRDAKLDEAVAVRDYIRDFPLFAGNLLADPGTLNNLNVKNGNVLYFLIFGSTNGTVWGTDIYTTDSTLAAVAVHAGIVKPGETRAVKVTILPGRETYQGSMRNGVNSSPWQSFPASFKIERGDERLDKDDNQAPDYSAESKTTQREISLGTGSLQTMGRNYNRVRSGF